jgi:hypothetical protein
MVSWISMADELEMVLANSQMSSDDSGMIWDDFREFWIPSIV